MLRKEVEKIEKRTGTMIAVNPAILLGDEEFAGTIKCTSCAAKGANLEEFYEPVIINNKTIGANYRPKLFCKKCKKPQSWDTPQIEKTAKKKSKN